ncbi:hypothetical protein [uncultured Desulfobacter sp.]|uniref:hypothetical protein n=1 Tax=uncultured Desulfobacter sp. TaxID=240139 RepID=UPI0029F5264B|nr:hypothetical protein [uncultured Desulfobacter sp.]
MKALRNILENPLLRNTHEQKRSDIKERFPELENCPHDHYLSIYKYIKNTPQRFYSKPVYNKFLEWLEDRNRTNQGEFQQYLIDNDAELNRALLHLEEINNLYWHDSIEKTDDFEFIRFIDQQIHPSYLRLIEAVFTPLCHIGAYFSRIDRGKGTDSLDLFPIVDEIKRTVLSDAVIPYKHIVRNAIAHGGITYLQNEILYQDKKGNKEKYSDRDIVRLFDDLIDSCNSLSLALSLFLLTNQPNGYKLPQQILLEELKEETKAPWWQVVGCTPSKFTGLNQLIIYARPNTADYGKVQFSTFQTGVLVERFAPGYDRYFFSISSSSSWPGWAAFNGKKLHDLRNKNDVILEDYKGVLENDLVFYVPRIKTPRFISRIHTFILSFKLNMPIVISDIKRKLGQPEINIREANIHRNAWGSVLKGSVFIDHHNSLITKDVIRKVRRKAIRKALSEARKNTPIYKIYRFLPLGYAHINVFCKDYRRRRLSGFGLGSPLICTIQIKRIKRIKSPDILGSTIEQLGGYRIAWNRAWLEEGTGQQ